jgi:type II secretory pathway component PulM
MTARPGRPSRRLVPAPLVRWWRLKAPRERRIVTALALVVVVAIGWLLVWQPLQQDVAALRAGAPAARAELAEAQRLAAEIAGLTRTPPPPAAPIAPARFEQVLAERGIPAGTAQVAWEDGRARLTLAAVRFDTLVAALDALARDFGLRAVEATLTARVDPGTVRAEIVLAP